MFKKKKTYLDKINFDIFEDNEPEDFDLFSKNPEEFDESEKDGLSKESRYNKDDSFSYDDFDNIEKELEDDKPQNPRIKKVKKKNTILIFLWVAVFCAGVFAFLYFQTNLFKKKNKKTTEDKTTETAIESTELTETTEELDEGFYTIYSYETNADININALMADYYDALVKGDSEKLKDIVTNPEAFGDMMIYETKAQVISEYSNITCYTIPGLNENEILVFTTSNVTITGVNSKPLDIKQFYVVKDGNNYKIDNGVLSQEVIDYINFQAGSPDVQALYKSVQDNINQCLAEDSTFADFYNMISTNTDAN